MCLFVFVVCLGILGFVGVWDWQPVVKIRGSVTPRGPNFGKIRKKPAARVAPTQGFLGGRTIPAGRTPLFLGGLKSYIPEDLSWSLFTHSTVGHIPGLAKNFFNDIRWREA